MLPIQNGKVMLPTASEAIAVCQSARVPCVKLPPSSRTPTN
jgi:hypothetical protein